MTIAQDQIYTFGAFRLSPSQKVLTEGGRRVRVGGRAFDLLVVLVERAGEVLGKSDLVERVWPGSVAEDGSLRAHVAALRKVLGEGRDGARFISNIAGRGYCFVAEVRTEIAERPGTLESVRASNPTNLPLSLTRMVGRGETLETLIERVRRERLLSIVGPGGIGKTTLALAIGEALLPEFPQGVWLIDLTSVFEESRICSVLATALDAPAGVADSLADLAGYLRDKQVLLIFDNCEHMLDAVARMAHEILRCGTRVHMLATSREPLRIAGERVKRLHPLDLPPTEGSPTVEAALRSSAVQLFVERAILAVESFELTESNVSFVVEVCRRLDGLPLAIELAAARIDSYGVRGLLVQLEDHVGLLSTSRRGVPERHRTLRSLIAWSYEKLSPSQQTLMRRLSVFSGTFTVDGAIAVAAHLPLDERAVFRDVAALTAKSLLSTHPQGDQLGYRMLFSTRAFARELFALDDDRRIALMSHVRFVADFLRGAEESAPKLSREEWMAANGSVVDDVRAALNWAFSESGDLAGGIALTSAAVSLGHGLSLYEEFRIYVERAIERLPESGAVDAVTEMRLHGALAALSLVTLGPTVQMVERFQQALTYVDGSGTAHEVEALNGLWIAMQTAGNHLGSERAAQRIAVIAQERDDPVLALTADRLLAAAVHFLGRHETARVRIENHLAIPAYPRRHGPPFPIDPRISLRCYLARIHWLQGRPDEAAEVASEALALASEEVSHALAMTLGWTGCPIAFWRGELELARDRTQWMYAHSNEHRLGNWRSWAQNFLVVLQQRERRERGEWIETPAPVRVGVADGMQRDVLRTLDESVEDVDTLARVRAGELGWCAPEILRVHAVLGLDRANPAAAAAMLSGLEEARGLAREQGALSWELRIAMDIARVRAARGEVARAVDELSATYHQFKEGFSTKDLVAARSQLARLNRLLGGEP